MILINKDAVMVVKEITKINRRVNIILAIIYIFILILGLSLTF